MKILNLDEDSHGDKVDYYMDVDAAIGKEKVHKNILLHNVGLRPAFVKLFATHGKFIFGINFLNCFVVLWLWNRTFSYVNIFMKSLILWPQQPLNHPFLFIYLFSL